jgi:hypothetical protein
MNIKNFLIRESAFEATPSVEKKEKNTIEFIAVLQEAGVPNRNGRIYHKYVLEQALNSPYVQERIRTKSFYLECGHPTESSVQRQMTIDQRNIAAILKEFWWEGNLLKGRIETANTAVGRDMKGLIEQGSKVAFSLRAQGNVHHDPILNATVVDAPIQIATYDWVVNPSHDKAFLEQICEDTRCSLFGVSEGSKLALVESVRLYEKGELIPMEEKQLEEKVVDYAKHFPRKIKRVKEAYIYDEKDVPTISGKFAMLKNGNVTKKVMVEDFVLKSLRHRIAKLTESEELGDAAAEPVHDDSKPKELTPELKSEDVIDSVQPAEEVKEVVVESEAKVQKAMVNAKIKQLEAEAAKKEFEIVKQAEVAGQKIAQTKQQVAAKPANLTPLNK